MTAELLISAEPFSSSVVKYFQMLHYPIAVLAFTIFERFAPPMQGIASLQGGRHMLTHEQLVCIQNYVETQTLHYIRRLFADIEYYLITQQKQMDSNAHSGNLGFHNDQRQFIKTVLSQSLLNEQPHDSDFPTLHPNEQPHDSDFSSSHPNEQPHDSDFPTSHPNEQLHERNFPTLHPNEQPYDSDFSLSHSNEQPHDSDFPTSHPNEQPHDCDFSTVHQNGQLHDRGFSMLLPNGQSLSLDFTHSHAQTNVQPENTPSIQENDMLNTAIAALPARYSNGHRVPQYYLERLKQTLQIIYSRPGIVRKELAVALQVSERTVSNLCSFLLKHHHIVIKNHRDGRWYPPVP